MKIRTRIMWISCIAVLAASLAGNAIIWILSRRSFMNEAFIKAYQNSYSIANEIEQTFDSNTITDTDERYLEYYFKSKGDDYNICFQSTEQSEENEIYNHTVLDAKSLESMDYQSDESLNSLEYAYLDREEGHYIILKKQLSNGLLYYRLEDISYIWEKMDWLMACMLAISLALTMLTSLIVLLALKHVFRPLQELNDTTKRMAEGFYDQRVHVRKQDEVGQLGESFNRMAEAVEARTRSLKESEKKKTLFMGDLTHELKTPMTAISGYAQTLLSTKISQEQQQEALLYIYEECGRLERLSGKMMKLLELDQEDGIELLDTKVTGVFEAVARSCASALKDKRMTLELSENGEILPMDADLMTDALINLIDNAIKASEQGEKIILKAYGRCIEVQDFGRGIPEEEQEKILEPFYMIDKSRSRKNSGAGLGLALTAMIAGKHNIHLHIESEPGAGTRIILQFV